MSNHLDYEINKELGECYLFMGDFDKAEEYYEKAVNSNGVHPDPYLGLATIAVQRGDLEKAHEHYAKAASIEPGDKSLTGMALVEMETERPEEAFGHLDQALQANPENLVALFSMVRLAHVIERIPEAVIHLRNYLVLDPLKHEVRFSLAGCLISRDDTDEAREELGRILEHDPGYEPAKELLAQLDESN
jgi:tetratricopeptide (TPR) repeat protein